MKRFLEMDGGDGYTVIWMYLIPLHRTCENSWDGKFYVMHMCVCAKSLQLCLILCNPMNCSPSGSSVHEILQTRVLDWVAMLSSGGSSQPRIEPASLMSPSLARGFFTINATCEAPMLCIFYHNFKNWGEGGILYTNVYSSFICNRQKLEIILMSFKK